MVVSRENQWLEVLERECGIRRALIIHGSIEDVCFSIDAQGYQPILDVLSRTLKRRGFDEVILWDRFDGVQDVSPGACEELERCVVQDDLIEKPTGENYDMEDGEPASQSSIHSISGRWKKPDEFFPIVYRNLLDNTTKRFAFIIDWSNYLFGNTQALSEQERTWLLILSKAIRNAPISLRAEDLERPLNTIVLLCSRLGGIPPSFYENNPMAKEIFVPLPGRRDREKFIQSQLHLFKFSKPIAGGQKAFDDFVDATDGLTLRDLQQMIRLSRQLGETSLTADKMINLYKYGEKISPWEELSRDKLKDVEATLKEWVKGQDEAIDKVARLIKQAYTGLAGLQHSKKQKMPKGILFFVGPTGVGKTELAKSIARFLFGDEDACLRFDMSEYNHEESDQRFVGAPPGYVGYEEGGQLTNAVKAKPFSVILFDEIEKAHPKILDKFLQILEDGRLTDGKGETVFFSETVIIFTSNIGVADVEVTSDPNETKNQFIIKVREHFIRELKRPELLNRIGNNIVPFNFITNDDCLVDIARMKLAPLREQLKEKYKMQDLIFTNEENALKAIVSKVDKSNGGRGVLNELQTRLYHPLADFIFSEEEDPGNYAGMTIRVIQVGSSAEFAFKLE